ncbi:hypothetical protein KM043_010088 [Ampulex compressa]|nr:hypothetical protein KM043_010088 [Ampulex compressa]
MKYPKRLKNSLESADIKIFFPNFLTKIQKCAYGRASSREVVENNRTTNIRSGTNWRDGRVLIVDLIIRNKARARLIYGLVVRPAAVPSNEATHSNNK